MKQVIALIFILLITVNAQSQLPTSAGVHEMVLPDSGRLYTLAIPDNYDETVPVPLILSLHYGGRVTPYFGRGLLEILIEPALGDLGAIIVAPDSATTGGWANADSERHLMELLDHIEANYNVDSTRTLVTGYSMGGAGTWYMAPRYPNRFAAALPMAGRPEPNLEAFAWETPMYVIHSTADELIALAPAKSAIEQLQAKGISVELAIIDDITHYQMALYRPHLRAAIPWIKSVWGE